MIVGEPSCVAIESGITRAFAELSLRGLGFFVLHVGGHRYGVHSPDATMLANSFDEVNRRLADRGRHTAPFATEPNAGRIADAVRQALYADVLKEDRFLGISQPE